MNTDDAVTATSEFIDDAARDRVTVRGADAASYLQSQIAQEIRDLDVGSARWTMVLDPTGKVDSLARIRRTADDEFVLDTDAGFGDALLARINRFKIRVDAETTVEHAEVDSPSVEHELARIAAGWPRMGSEIEPGSTIPTATGVVLVAVNFQKGCYPGQELVERMDSRGADAPRTLRIVDLSSGAVPGDPVHDSDGKEVGAVTSVSGDGGLGLAYVKRGADVGRPPAHLT
ncbi:CAF17-like 4Fe-4S cluster assembly/insertion protein YgfZ [Ilumatobacter nonamiensis]|uniref:CAF17-like 4Fe-4S cluster assembly/insertion protein YgfZ n=1 Tax=Ilumatobacter nonamiensis TaxID=467093 RepID=UPI0003492A3C|nr:folate-binding protein YgfZ [Ilumatobacter nonamiensis]